MKFSLALIAVPAALLAFSSACDDGSAAIDCTLDTDCPAETPICDETLLICVADEEDNTPDECAENIDCQLINPDAPTSIENCDNDDDCADDGTELFEGTSFVCE